jgi:LL-diaminopimelate aminotransferase
VQLAGVAALSPDADAEVASMNELYRAGATSSATRCAQAGVEGAPAARHDLHLGAGPEGLRELAAYCEHVLEQAAVVISPGGAYGPNGEGFFRISLTTPDDRLLEAVERLRARCSSRPSLDHEW